MSGNRLVRVRAGFPIFGPLNLSVMVPEIRNPFCKNKQESIAAPVGRNGRNTPTSATRDPSPFTEASICCVHWSAWLRVCVSMRCGCVSALWLRVCVATWLCGYVSAWLRGCVCVAVGVAVGVVVGVRGCTRGCMAAWLLRDCACVAACVRACLRGYVSACVRECVCVAVCVAVFLRGCVAACL